MVQIINDMNEFKAFLTAAGHKLAVVEFSSKWCGPCKRMVPVFHELAETCHIKIIPTFQMFKKSQKVTLFSRIKRMICCYRSGFMSNPIFEFSGADAKQLEAKIQELM
ncbi:PREDICTED: thioredoxin domain-containing protein 8 isoform X6 [Rhinopithecus bieti]|uniref:thioredoxin domain-containing protein 8 isoform X6 n=1 Tax=Rhinopithecus bieti TaxID=61621 RepID=UPI00083BE385|nr:PREDICTED: thioredoxin domain-containing protein 8 isoform X6 [Rhinopithecus bieti]